jgi:ligand-binding SRPBCC domain-containing protein
MYSLSSEVQISRPIEEVFPFFADASKLEALTPPWLRFEILTKRPIRMETGTLIDYRLRIHGFPVRWQSEITDWDPPYRFVDEQRRGPYRVWRHTHRFEERDGTTLVSDFIEYAVRGGPLAPLVHRFVVRRDLDRIFAYRREKLLEIFGPGGSKQ